MSIKFITLTLSMITVLSLSQKNLNAKEDKNLINLIKQSKTIPEDKFGITFQIEKNIDGFVIDLNKKTITASNTQNLLAGYGYFLKNVQKLHWSWSASRMTPISTVNIKSNKISVPEQWIWRYAYNYCTLSYTSAFWGKQEWAQEIDRMALNGMQQMLVQAGLEKVWQLTLQELNYPEEQIKKFIPNPAFAAWWNMGNLEGHGGPLTQNLIDQEAELGRFIVERMRSYGMEPVLQGFIGLVPSDLEKYYVPKGDARFLPQGKWVAGFVRPAVLDPTTEAFQKVATIWYKNLEKVYGIKPKYLGGDLFHEGGNSRGIDVKKAATCVQNSMQKAFPQSIWVLQAWGGNPSGRLLSGLDNDKSLVLGLCKNLKDGTNGNRVRYFDGKSWVWCELLNFGGNQGLYGSLQVLGNIGKLQEARGKDQLVGLGMISEGTEQNPMYYDLFYDRFWMDKTKNMSEEEINIWIENYSERRYGQRDENAIAALKLLERSVYRPSRDQEGCTESILCARPGRNINKASTWASGTIYYSLKDVRQALTLLIKAGEQNPSLLKTETFQYDLVDVTRQFLSDMARPLLAETMDFYDAGNKEMYNEDAELFLSLIADTDRILSTHSLWRFGRTYEMALAKGKTLEEKRLSTIAAKMLVTTWSGRIDGLNDYAHRQLAGLMKEYYYQRWNIFFANHKKVLNGELEKNKVGGIYGNEVREFEKQWAKNDLVFSAKPSGENTLLVAKEIFQKYEKKSDFLFASKPSVIGRKWTLRDGVTELEFDVSEDIMSVGTYTGTFKYQRGAHALKIYGAKLYEGEKLIAEDKHEGSTGVVHNNNTFTFKVEQMRTNLAAYKIKARVKGDGGHDSNGEFIFKKIK